MTDEEYEELRQQVHGKVLTDQDGIRVICILPKGDKDIVSMKPYYDTVADGIIAVTMAWKVGITRYEYLDPKFCICHVGYLRNEHENVLRYIAGLEQGGDYDFYKFIPEEDKDFIGGASCPYG